MEIPRNSVLYTHCIVDAPTHPGADAVWVRNGVIRWIGSTQHADDEISLEDTDVVDLREYGATIVMPAFVDAHTHLTPLGSRAGSTDLSAARTPDEMLHTLRRVARSHPVHTLLFAPGWDPGVWGEVRLPSVAELDAAVGDIPVYAPRVDVHSALASSALRRAVPELSELPGYTPDGPLTRDAHHAVRAYALGSRTMQQREAAQRHALSLYAEQGYAAVHECGGPEIGGAEEFEQVLHTAQTLDGVEVIGLWGEPDVEKARALGARAAAGDIFIDGSLGSATAALRESYACACPSVHTGVCTQVSPHAGTVYMDVEEIAEHLSASTQAGMFAGFHAIGDAAIDVFLQACARTAERVGLEALRAAGHRVEHAHMLDDEAVRCMVRYGVVASVQPLFDTVWGGESGFYARRLGAARARSLMPLAALSGTGVLLALGSDAPAGPLDAWGAVRASVMRHEAQHALTPRTAFTAHTRGAWRAAGDTHAGTLSIGAPAHMSIWRIPDAVFDEVLTPQQFLKEVATYHAEPSIVATVARGRRIFSVWE